MAAATPPVRPFVAPARTLAGSGASACAGSELRAAGVHPDDGVVPLVADWTDGSDEIKDVLNQLGSNTIPVYAIFSAERPNEPIVLRDLVTKKHVIAALTAAGPAKPTRVATTVR